MRFLWQQRGQDEVCALRPAPGSPYFLLSDLPAVQNAPADTRAFAADFRMQDGMRAEENRKNRS